MQGSRALVPAGFRLGTEDVEVVGVEADSRADSRMQVRGATHEVATEL